MKLEGSREVESSAESVWDFVSSTKNMAECLPEAKSCEVVDEITIKAQLKVGVGFIKEVFDSVIKYQDLDRENGRMKMSIEAKAKSNIANIDIDVSITGDGSKSTISWMVNAVMAGRLASVGQRYISKAADKIIQGSFECMTSKLSSP